jgi:hybrid polyketide synthase/nonribosomal peptide synthetase ACE1
MLLSRVSGLHNATNTPLHPLLGRRCHDRETAQCIQWRNVLHQKEIPWLTGHRVQGQAVYPAAAYVAMAVENITTLASNTDLGLIEIRDFQI